MIKLADLPDDFTPDQFRNLDRESLDSVSYTLKKWLCQCKGCTNGTTVRDYGLPIYMLNRNSKRSHDNPRDYWMGRNNYWLCGKHNRFFKKLEKRFDFEHVWRRLIDQGKTVIVEIPATKTLTIVEPIEKRTT